MEKARMLGMELAVAGGTEGGRSPTGVPPATAAAATGVTGDGRPIPDPAVLEKPVRRRFTAEYKLRVLQEADRSTGPGQLGACCDARACTRRCSARGGTNATRGRWPA